MPHEKTPIFYVHLSEILPNNVYTMKTIKTIKTTLAIVTCIALFGFNSWGNKTAVNTNSKRETTEKPQFIKTPASCFGLWIQEDYLKALQKTHSTKKAQEMAVDDFYRISNDNSVMRQTLHEGGADNILLMTTETKGQLFSSDTLEAYSQVEFKDNTMIIKNKTYIKAPSIENGLTEMVNRTLFSGEYIVGNQTITFLENGQINGLDSIVCYEANLDYIDAGMQYDKMDIQFKKEKEPRTYIYQIVSDTLVLFNIQCLTMDEELDYCVEIEKGTEFLKLKKKK